MWKKDVNFELIPFRDKLLTSSIPAIIAVVNYFVSKPGMAFKGLPDALRRAQKVWRGFTQASYKQTILGPSGAIPEWVPARSPKNVQYMRNCPPALMVALAGDDTTAYRKMHYCNRYEICPFCYARRVSAVYIGVERTLRSHKLLKTDDKQLVLGQAKFLTTPSNMKSVVEQIYAWRINKFKAFGMDGVLYHCSVVPYDNTHWQIQARYTFMVPKDWAIPDEAAKSKLKVLGPVNCTTLVTAVGKTMLYPIGLLRADIHHSVPLLNALKADRLRLTERLGKFRAPRCKKDVKD